jgi:hypothetical protein
VNTTSGNLNNSGLTTDGTHSFATTTADDNMSVLGNKYTYWNYDVNKVSFTLARIIKSIKKMQYMPVSPMVSDLRMKKLITTI